jgi:hypothetical protein
LNKKGEPIILESSTKDVEVDIGDNFEFDCKAQGYPRPNISWIRAESKPLHGGIAKYNVKKLIISNDDAYI